MAGGARTLAAARPLGPRRYVDVWADGVYSTPRLEHERQGLVILIGADASGRKELLAVEDGWRELPLRLRDENGLALDPELATGDGAPGFWQALHEVWPKAKRQRCWVHKTASISNALPKASHGPVSCAAIPLCGRLGGASVFPAGMGAAGRSWLEA